MDALALAIDRAFFEPVDLTCSIRERYQGLIDLALDPPVSVNADPG